MRANSPHPPMSRVRSRVSTSGRTSPYSNSPTPAKRSSAIHDLVLITEMYRKRVQTLAACEPYSIFLRKSDTPVELEQNIKEHSPATGFQVDWSNRVDSYSIDPVLYSGEVAGHFVFTLQ